MSSVGVFTSFLRWSTTTRMEEMDLANRSATCQFAIFIVRVEREAATISVWEERVHPSELDEWCFVPLFPTLQS